VYDSLSWQPCSHLHLLVLFPGGANGCLRMAAPSKEYGVTVVLYSFPAWPLQEGGETRPLRYTTATTWAATSRRTRAIFCVVFTISIPQKCIGHNILVYLLGRLKFFPWLHGCERKELTETEAGIQSDSTLENETQMRTSSASNLRNCRYRRLREESLSS